MELCVFIWRSFITWIISAFAVLACHLFFVAALRAHMHPSAAPGMHVWELTAAHILLPDWGSESSHMLICYPAIGDLGGPVC